MATKMELETIVNFDEEINQAKIYTHNQRLLHRMQQLAKERPGECKMVIDNQFGGQAYTFPKGWVKINPTRLQNEEQKKRLSELGKRHADKLRVARSTPTA